jgi:hypothetical protein
MAKRRGVVATSLSFKKAVQDIAAAAKRLGTFGLTLRVIGEEIMTDVKASRAGHGVPVDTGTLRSTGRVEGPKGTPLRPYVELSFGGAAAPYALTQHEELSLFHKIGEARYLVRGVERWRAGGSAALKSLRAQARAALVQTRK